MAESAGDAAVKKLHKKVSNRACADCECKGTQYVVVKLGVFLCSACAGSIRELGFIAKGINLSSFSQAEAEAIIGNKAAAKQYLAHWTPGAFPKPVPGDTERIRKYQRKKYADKAWYAAAAEHTLQRGNSVKLHISQHASSQAESLPSTASRGRTQSSPAVGADLDFFGGATAATPAPGAARAGGAQGVFDSTAGGAAPRPRAASSGLGAIKRPSAAGPVPVVTHSPASVREMDSPAHPRRAGLADTALVGQPTEFGEWAGVDEGADPFASPQPGVSSGLAADPFGGAQLAGQANETRAGGPAAAAADPFAAPAPAPVAQPEFGGWSDVNAGADPFASPVAPADAGAASADPFGMPSSTAAAEAPAPELDDAKDFGALDNLVDEMRAQHMAAVAEQQRQAQEAELARKAAAELAAAQAAQEAPPSNPFDTVDGMDMLAPTPAPADPFSGLGGFTAAPAPAPAPVPAPVPVPAPAEVNPFDLF